MEENQLDPYPTPLITPEEIPVPKSFLAEHKVTLTAIGALIAIIVIGSIGYYLLQSNTKVTENPKISGTTPITEESTPLKQVKSIKAFGNVIVTPEGEYSIGQDIPSGIEIPIEISENSSSFTYQYKFEGRADQQTSFVNLYGEEDDPAYSYEESGKDGYTAVTMDFYEPLWLSVQCKRHAESCKLPLKGKIIIQSSGRNNPGLLRIKELVASIRVFTMKRFKRFYLLI